MDLILTPSGGRNIVLWPGANPTPYAISDTAPASVEVWIGRTNESPTEANLFATFRPGELVRIPRSRAVNKSLRIYLRSVGPSGRYDRTYLSEAHSFDVSWTKKPPILDSIDSERPTVGAAPLVRRLDVGDAKQWVIYPFAPSASGFSWDAVRIRIRKADDLSVLVLDHTIAPTPRYILMAAAFDCVVDYKVRNKNVDDEGGWSDWSETANAFGLSSDAGEVNEPDSTLITHDFDPNETTNYTLRNSLYDEA